MIRSISDVIEQYIKEVIGASRMGMVELQRNELAEQFQCVPSQINYVIATRFSLEHGYIVESKRGGGGYIRIREIQLDESASAAMLVQTMGDSLSQREADGIVDRLQRAGIVATREAAMMRAAVRRETLQVPLPARDTLRSRLVMAMVIALLSATESGAQGECSDKGDGSVDDEGDGGL